MTKYNRDEDGYRDDKDTALFMGAIGLFSLFVASAVAIFSWLFDMRDIGDNALSGVWVSLVLVFSGLFFYLRIPKAERHHFFEDDDD